MNKFIKYYNSYSLNQLDDFNILLQFYPLNDLLDISDKIYKKLIKNDNWKHYKDNY